ncbi:MAG: dephospho-CoA kinase [Phycisphaeraceae bacterium]
MADGGAQIGKPVIGLLGAPGSGKSLVARQFASLGCAVIDADAIAHAVLDEEPVKRALRDWLGPDVVGEAGRVDRRRVGARVFGDGEALARLEGLVHPRVGARRAELRAAYAADAGVRAIVEDSPLLIEKGLDAHCDVLVYVDAPRAVRAARVGASRGWSEADLDRREKNQASLDMKRSRADYVIDNSADEAGAQAQVRRVLWQILHERDQT